MTAALLAQQALTLTVESRKQVDQITTDDGHTKGGMGVGAGSIEKLSNESGGSDAANHRTLLESKERKNLENNKFGEPWCPDTPKQEAKEQATCNHMLLTLRTCSPRSRTP